MTENINIGGRLHSVATEHIVAGANEIQDDILNKTQAQINEEVNNILEIHDSVIEGLNSQNYKSYTATNTTTAITDILPALGTVDTIYRLGNWDGEQYDTTQYAEYAWINTGIDQGEYVLLDIKKYGIDDEPTAGSDNLVKSGGVYEELSKLGQEFSEINVKTISDDNRDFSISDENGYNIVQFIGGHIKTKYFDSESVVDKLDTIENGAEVNNTITFNDDNEDFSISDENNYCIAKFKGGHIKTKYFDSESAVINIEVPLCIYKLNLSTKIDIIDTEDENSTSLSIWRSAINNDYLYNDGHYGWNNKLILNRQVCISDKQFVFDFSIGVNGIAYFGSSGTPAEYTTDNKQTLISVNFSNGTLNIHNGLPAVVTSIPSVCASTNVSLTPDKKYRVVVSRSKRVMSVHLFNITNEFTLVGSVSIPFNGSGSPCGHLYDRPTCFSEVADLKLYGLNVNIPMSNNKNCYIYIGGDSITEGWLTNEDESYGFLLASDYPWQTVKVSGRGMGSIINLIARLHDEAIYLNPDYVFVLIGTNDSRQTDPALKGYYQDIIDYVCNTMEKKLILCHIPMSLTSTHAQRINNIIDEVLEENATKNISCVKFDIATALNNDPSQGYNSSLFPDGVHPNAEGYRIMYNQIKIDCPELFIIK